jgi:hypothetical protein
MKRKLRVRLQQQRLLNKTTVGTKGSKYSNIDSANKLKNPSSGTRSKPKLSNVNQNKSKPEFESFII